MLKTVLRYDLIKKLLPILLMLAVMFGSKLYLANGFDREYAAMENQLVSGTAGLDPNSAKQHVEQKSADMLEQILTKYSGFIREEKAEQLARVKTDVQNNIEIYLAKGYDNINEANNKDVRSTMPSDYFTINIDAYKNLTYPDLIAGSVWNYFFTLRGSDFVLYFIFIAAALIFVRPYEERIYLADMLTKWGIKYHSTRFNFFLILILVVTAANFAGDVLISEVLNCADDIFTAGIRGLEQFCDSFSNMTVFGYLMFWLIMQLLAAINMYCFFFLLARGMKDAYKFTVVSITAVLFLNILKVTMPNVSGVIAAGAPDMITPLANAAYFGGIDSTSIMFAANVVVSIALIIIVEIRFVRR